MQQTDPSVVGKWSEFATWDLTPVHISLLPNGKVLFWSRDKTADGNNAVGNSRAYVWNPGSTTVWNPTLGTRSYFPNSTTNLFCTGHSLLPDGRLIVTGGHADAVYDGIGEKHTNIFNFNNNTWLRAPDMNNGRWYPFNVTLGSGEPLVVSGAYWDGTYNGSVPNRIVNPFPQVFSGLVHWRDLPRQPSDVPNYPWLYLLRDGKVFVSGPQRQSYYLDPNTGSWSTVAASNYLHDIGGSSVMYAPGKVMNVGGYAQYQGVTNSAEIIDLYSASPSWSPIAPMWYPRINHTAVALPDSKVLVFGGSQCVNAVTTNAINCAGGAVFEPEMWDSSNTMNPWVRMASSAPNPATGSQVPRLYHSVALLLPDARVLVGGGGLPAADGENTGGVPQGSYGHNDVQIFSPPYLFNPGGALATRPVINSAPPSVSYGQTFFIGTDAGSNAKVSLVRLPSVTHGFNQDQRVVPLATPTNVTSSGFNVVAPVKADDCPPGHYMLFVLRWDAVNSKYVPSVAKIIKVQQDDGYLDGTTFGQIWGWAWDRNLPNTPINVDIYADSTRLATVSANLFRQDLLNAGKGNGYHAFAYNIPLNTSLSLRDGKMHYISVKFAGTNNHLNWGPRVIGSLFSSTLGPVDVASAGGSTWEQSVRFTTSANGKITHIRFYKAPGETGTHVGRIWSDTGVKLAEVTFTNETPSGLQTQELPTPLQIGAGVTYRVSYNVNLYGAKIWGGLSSPISNGVLTALGGAYSTPAGSFPNTGSTSNFYADVLFSAP